MATLMNVAKATVPALSASLLLPFTDTGAGSGVGRLGTVVKGQVIG